MNSALLAHLDGPNCAEFAHILGALPLVFAEDATGRARKAQLLSVFDGMVVIE